MEAAEEMEPVDEDAVERVSETEVVLELLVVVEMVVSEVGTFGRERSGDSWSEENVKQEARQEEAQRSSEVAVAGAQEDAIEWLVEEDAKEVAEEAPEGEREQPFTRVELGQRERRES